MLPYFPFMNPQGLYYFLYPSYNQTIASEISAEASNLKGPEDQKQPLPLNQEQRIFITRQDLERQGYVQTKKPWTEEEDRLLLRLCKNENARFQEIAMHIQGRNAKMCYSRYRRLCYQTRVCWNKTLDDKLIELVKEYGENDWKHISAFFQGRTHKQIKDHYQNYLKSQLSRNDWTLEEDLQLIRLLNIHGKNWKQIEGGLVGRSRNQIKNRFFGRITRLNNKKMSHMKADGKVFENSTKAQ